MPKPLLKAFDWPAIRSLITVDGVITLADAEAVAAGHFAGELTAAQIAAGEHDTPLGEVFEDQIACADIVLLTKADLAGEAGVAAARAVIAAEAAEKGRRIPVLTMSDGVIDPRIILGLNARAEDDLAARPSHHDGEDGHEHDDFDSVVVTLGEVADPAALTAAIQRLARERNILRVKGYVAVAGKPLRMLVQAVGERVRVQYDRPWGAVPRMSHLVVIAEQADIDEAAIRAVLEA